MPGLVVLCGLKYRQIRPIPFRRRAIAFQHQFDLVAHSREFIPAFSRHMGLHNGGGTLPQCTGPNLLTVLCDTTGTVQGDIHTDTAAAQGTVHLCRRVRIAQPVVFQKTAGKRQYPVVIKCFVPARRHMGHSVSCPIQPIKVAVDIVDFSGLCNDTAAFRAGHNFGTRLG